MFDGRLFSRSSWGILLLALLSFLPGAGGQSGTASVSLPSIPLPEHPRPDFQRPQWTNLNGSWEFQFDERDMGWKEEWYRRQEPFSGAIQVPFSWGSPLSGVEDRADIAWYARSVVVPREWQGRRVFLVVGACDWRTTAWLDGVLLGTHRGGYTPFEFELTPHLHPGQEQRLVLRVDDTPHPFKLEGKQGYGPARGIWQTPYLEARGEVSLSALHFYPDIDGQKVRVRAYLSEPAPRDLQLRLDFLTAPPPSGPVNQPVPAGREQVEFEVPLPGARLWTLEDPFLYQVRAILGEEDGTADRVETYFGMRHIGVVSLPETGYRYISLNHQPIYLQATLDQAYHPQGFYTFPSDEFIRDEILRSRRIGLNAMRVHVKIPLPRKLYWADRLGMLIMADVPNSWGEPDPEMRRGTEHALRGMIQRDFNHPSIFSWVIFNETWGLRTGDREYTRETQEWVASMYRLAKALDPTRLVEDNSPNREDHVATDLNSWHAYLPGYAWREKLEEVSRNTYPGSPWNFVEGRSQGDQPNLNSECGNVWGYEGSTGDVDWSWDYHWMINEFRRHPRICGWLYTEHHDVINEWNGYYRYDRSEKFPGFSELVPGMSLRDLHSGAYVTAGDRLSQEVLPGSRIQVPLWVSYMTGDRGFGDRLRLRARLYGWDSLGRERHYGEQTRWIPFRPWTAQELPPLEISMPDHPSLLILALFLEDPFGSILHRNFTTFLVTPGELPREETWEDPEGTIHLRRFAPSSFARAEWSAKQWNILEGRKVNGAGFGFFEYKVPWPGALSLDKVEEAAFHVEVSAKQLLGKDREGSGRIEGNFMRGRGTHDPSLNPNAYPMTDTVPFPSAVRVRVNGVSVGVFELPDDPADHRGILSWHSQLRDRRLREAGSYGYLVQASIPRGLLERAARQGEFVIRLEVDEGLPGGLAVYGARFGRYPLDPTLSFRLASP